MDNTPINKSNSANSGSVANDELVSQFLAQLRAEGLTEVRVLKYRYTLARLGRVFPDFKNLTREAAINGFNELRNGVKPNTYRDYQILFRRFMVWLYKTPRGQLPLVIDWIHPGRTEHKIMRPEEMINEAEIDRIVKTAKTARDKALIYLCFELGVRPGELIKLRVGDITPASAGAYFVRIDGSKTPYSKRSVPLVGTKAINAFKTWLEEHPLRNQPNFENMPLWVKTNGRQLRSARAFSKMLGNVETLAGITKPHHPYHLRHSRGTILSNNPAVSHSHNCLIMGWARNSSMPEVYQHNNEQDALNALLRSRTDTPEDDVLVETAVNTMLANAEFWELVKERIKERYKEQKPPDFIAALISEPAEKAPQNWNYLVEAPRGLDKKSSRKKGLKGGGQK